MDVEFVLVRRKS